MIENYLKVALRNIMKNKVSVFIGVVCLFIGLAGSIIAINYVIFESTYDAYHKDAENIYLVRGEIYTDNEVTDKVVPVQAAVGPTIKESSAQIVEMTRVRIPWTLLGKTSISYKNKEFIETAVFFVDSTFFKVFPYELIAGNPETALKDPNSIVITESYAKKYFGDEDPLNKNLEFETNNSKYICTITGIMKNPPQNTNLKLTLLISMETYFVQYNRGWQRYNWSNYAFYTFLKLAPNADPKEIEDKLNQFADEKVPLFMRKNNSFTFSLIPLADYHLAPRYRWNIERLNTKSNVYAMLTLSIVFLILSLVNFTNLSTICSIQRAKEISIRKVVGGQRKQFMIQFFIEGLISNLFALFVAILFVKFFASFFYQSTGRDIPLIVFSDLKTWIFMFLFAITGAILSGWYPSIILSSGKAINVLRNRESFQRSQSGYVSRKTFTVLQFSLALFFIIGVLITVSQLRFMKNFDLGFDKENVIVIPRPVGIRDSIYFQKVYNFTRELEDYHHITAVTGSSNTPGTEISDARILTLKNSEGLSYPVKCMKVDYDFFKLYDLKFLAGRAFSKEFGADDKAIIINETAYNLFNFKSPEEALNHQLQWLADYNIIGVIQDYHQETIKRELSPIAFFLISDPKEISFYSIKYEGESMNNIIKLISQKWDNILPDMKFDYYDLIDNYNLRYKEDKQFIRAMSFNSILLLLLSCLGIFGLSNYESKQRSKEISIRKIYGASISNILFILSKDTYVLIAISLLITCPVAYIWADKWLSGFAYRVPVSFINFVFAGIIIIIISVLTISYYLIKAATQNPIIELNSGE